MSEGRYKLKCLLLLGAARGRKSNKKRLRGTWKSLPTIRSFRLQASGCRVLGLTWRSLPTTWSMCSRRGCCPSSMSAAIFSFSSLSDVALWASSIATSVSAPFGVKRERKERAGLEAGREGGYHRGREGGREGGREVLGLRKVGIGVVHTSCQVSLSR
jgi:hypothetical protein